MDFTKLPDNEHVSKGFMRKLLDTLYTKMPMLKNYVPSFFNTITKYMSSELVDNFHYFEELFNNFMEIYRSNMSNEEKINEVKKILPDNMQLKDEEIMELFGMLDDAMALMNNNVKAYSDKMPGNIDDMSNFAELLNNSQKEHKQEQGPEQEQEQGQEQESMDSDNSSMDGQSLKGMMNLLQKQIINKTSDIRKNPGETQKENVEQNPNMGRLLFQKYDEHYGKSNKISEYLLKTPDGRDIPIDSNEAFELMLVYAQKCLQNHIDRGEGMSSTLQEGGETPVENKDGKEDGKEGKEDKEGKEGKEGNKDNGKPKAGPSASPLLNENKESLDKQYGFMQDPNATVTNEELNEELYIPADIGGKFKDNKNDRVLYRFQYDILNNKMNILSRLLIALSAVPVFGWFFDVLLVIYAFFTKDFKLAIYTIIGALSVIGREFAKALYLLDESQQMKKTLTDPSYARYNVDSKDSSRVKETTPEIINGEYVLVDEDGNIFSPVIEKQEKIGKLSSDKTRVHFFNGGPKKPYDNVYKNVEIKDAKTRKTFINDIRRLFRESNLDVGMSESEDDSSRPPTPNTQKDNADNMPTPALAPAPAPM